MTRRTTTLLTLIGMGFVVLALSLADTAPAGAADSKAAAPPVAPASGSAPVVTTADANAKPAPAPKPKWLKFEAHLVTPQNGNWDAQMSGDILIGLESETSDAVRQVLLVTLKEKGQMEALKVLENQPEVGYINLPAQPGYKIRYARKSALPDGGTRYVLATDSPEGMTWGANLDSMKFPFLLIEIRMPKTGWGEGKVIWQGQLTLTKDNELVVNNYNNAPTTITAVKIFGQEK